MILHEDRAVRGHALVVARRHVENVSDLMPSERARFLEVLAAAERALLEATGVERAVLMKLGITTPHLHVHIYPVSATLDRAAVMAIIDGKVRDEVPDGFAERVRGRMGGILTLSSSSE